MAKRCLKCIISGRVQGVWYRAHTQTQAEKLVITGWVRNLPNGQVETLICGEEESVTMMQTWLTKGPPMAKVLNVEVEEVSVEVHKEHTEFKIID